MAKTCPSKAVGAKIYHTQPLCIHLINSSNGKPCDGFLLLSASSPPLTSPFLRCSCHEGSGHRTTSSISPDYDLHSGGTAICRTDLGSHPHILCSALRCLSSSTFQWRSPPVNHLFCAAKINPPIMTTACYKRSKREAVCRQEQSKSW